MNRDISMDTLRTTAAMLVVLVHISLYYVHEARSSKLFDADFWLSNSVYAISRICIPLFVLLSGRFLVGRNEGNLGVFYRKRFHRIFIPLVFWTVFYVILRIIVSYISKGEVDLIPIVKSLILGKPYYHLWYLYLLLGLYAIIPMINFLLSNISSKIQWVLAWGFMGFGFLLELYDLRVKNAPFFLLWFSKYIGYLIFGYLLRDSKHIPNVLLVLIFIVTSILSAIASGYTVIQFNSSYFYYYLSPFLIAGGLLFYKLFSQLKIKKNFLSEIAYLTLGIYLIHPLFVLLFRKVTILIGLEKIIKNILLEISIQFVFVFAFSLLTSLLIFKTKWLRKVIS